jgi:hypothetical protein
VTTSEFGLLDYKPEFDNVPSVEPISLNVSGSIFYQDLSRSPSGPYLLSLFSPQRWPILLIQQQALPTEKSVEVLPIGAVAATL